LTGEVRAATVDDLAEIARIHKSRFGGNEYTLGQYSLSMISAFYRLFLQRCVFLVHVSGRGVDGFVLGGHSHELSDTTHAFFRRHPFRCGIETMLSPRVWPAAFRSLRKLFFSPRKIRDDAANGTFRLLSIAVDKSAEGTGTAAALVHAFESRVRARHCGYELKVLKSNRQAVRFYEKLGLVIDAEDSPTHYRFKRKWDLPAGPCQHGP